MADKIAKIDIEFTVAHVGFGGNAGRGRYFYSFSPDVVLVGKDQSPVKIIYRLDQEVSKHFKIKNVLSTDSKDQIERPKVHSSGRHVSLINKNTVPTLILFSVLVYDEKRKNLFSCDPQVSNDPEIKPLLPLR